MNLLSKALTLSALCGFACGAALAQQAAPAKNTAQAEAGEPRADTSLALPGGAPPASPDAGMPAAGGLPKGSAADAAPTGGPSAAAKPPGKAAARPAGAGEKPVKTSDRVDLDTTTVTGNRELPKVLYIVPWKKSDIGDLLGKPMNSLLDEVLAPVDRDVFRREVVYYRAVSSDATQNGAPGAQPGKQGEK
jgi:hypothetical protein